MKKLITIWLIFWLLQISIKSHEAEQGHDDSSYLVMDQDIERYADLWEDADKQRFLKFILDIGYGHAMKRSKEDLATREWAWAQKEKAFPLLLEILRREPHKNEEKPDLEWTNISRKGYVIEYALESPHNDLRLFVEEVRKQLPYVLEQKEKSGKNSIFIRESLELLSTKGDASDISLIEGFLEDPNRNNRSYARKNLAALKERLAKELDENRKDRVVRGDRESSTSENKLTNLKSSPPNSTQLDSAKTQKNSTFWYIVSALGVIVLMTLFQFWKRKS